MSAENTPAPSTDDPDVMNDPAFDPSSDSQRKKSVDESDTCRICRAEGSAEEPLFYPCKCSGSIKFVHQNCLMEWLSHSQKKHCELCKTQFRFTKLYHPHMPTAVPPFVFLRQVVIHTWKSVVAWSRMQLVVLVWLCWLPWAMRNVWRALFYLGDGGWFNWVQMEQEASRAAREHLDKLAAEGTSPAPQKFFPSGEFTASIIMSRLTDAFPQMISRTLNLSIGEGMGFRPARGVISSLMGRIRGSSAASVPQVSNFNSSDIPAVLYRTSWLSDVGFLKNLTRFPVFNHLLIDTLEGQIITSSVVIAFILIFLIREWVVQQQPVVNMPLVEQAQAPMHAIDNGNPPEEEVNEPEADAQEHASETSETPNPHREEALLPDSAAEQKNEEGLTDDSEANDKDKWVELVQAHLSPQAGPSETQEFLNTKQRPGMPDRRTLARAAEIRRTIEEQFRNTGQDWQGLKIFVNLWARAGHRPLEVIRIIEDEGRREELAWVIAAMWRLENISVADTDQPQSWKDVDGEPTSSLGNSASNGERSRSEAAGSDLTQLISDPEYDPNSSLGEIDRHDDSRTQQGPSISGFGRTDNVTVLDTEPTGVDQLTHRSDSAPLTQASEASTNSTNQAISPSAQEVDNPFHPDYTGPLPQPPTTLLASQHPSQVELREATLDAIERNQPVSPLMTQGTMVGTEQNRSFADKTMTWLWGPGRAIGLESGVQAAPDDEHVVQDLANEAPFVPMEHGQLLIDGNHPDDPEEQDGEPAHNPQAVGEGVQAGGDGNEVEGADEVEDMEGVMELVGMQGPVAGLIQNGMFCAVLVSLTLVFAIWIPYIMGKLFLTILANPLPLLIKMPLRLASWSADVLSDMIIFTAACVGYWLERLFRFACSPLGRFELCSMVRYERDLFADGAKRTAEKALERLTDAMASTSDSLAESDIPTFSIIAHESLQSLQQWISSTIDSLISTAAAICTSEPSQYLGFWPGYRETAAAVVVGSSLALEKLSVWTYDIVTWLGSLRDVNFLRLNVGTAPRSYPLDFRLAYWDTKDRAVTVLFGYLFFAVLGVLYLRLSHVFQGKREGGKVKGILADVLYQAGGVMKVILIISIEMIVFPLYCGLLLDIALLPLFRNVTTLSRLEFMVGSPYTSLFVHWFVGTCYMFHFALFVSMCRKILRTGVLFFIRDPDDPTFHPVRDVLERSVFTQLCKIAFSALVYGGLVIVCLGGVVWGISSAFEGVFPIHWSSNEPVLEFPVDLLFYNFLMPLAVKVLRPSDGLTVMYAWWFRRCARGLRLSHFLFDDKREDEEGRQVRRRWKDVLAGKEGDAKNPVIGKDRQQLAEDRGLDAFFLRDGKYVRTPASDQVRIPKGAHTFVEVDEAGNRIDGQPDTDDGLHGRKNQQFSIIYIPPNFRLRIAAFIFLLWLFAAATGLSLTVIPLVFGRFIFSYLFPFHPRMNDIYAFSIGINILGGAGFFVLNARRILAYARHQLIPSHESRAFDVLRKAAYYTLRLVRVLYTYTAFVFLLPSLVALVEELYVIIPLHTYFGAGVADHHTIYFIQDWTLGVLWVNVMGRFILSHDQARPAIALCNIIKDGWTDPNATLATRGFIFPATLLLSLLMTAPLCIGRLVTASSFFLGEAARNGDVRSAVYRYSYPAVLALGFAALVLRFLAKAFEGWKRRIRDEVYLIGERLHNFGERRTAGAAVGGTRVGM